MMEYKGYVGQIQFDNEANIFHGEVINTRDVITFQGESVAELRQALKDSVEDYLAFCRQQNKAPDKPYSGQFVTRVGADVHRRISLAARVSGLSLNAWVGEQLQKAASDIESAMTMTGGAGKPVPTAKRNSGQSARAGTVPPCPAAHRRRVATKKKDTPQTA